MTSPLPDPATTFGAKVRARLAEEAVAWLTVVAPDGTPQPNPVAFLWNGDDRVLVYSQAGAARLSHLASNPRVALSFNNRHGFGDVVVLTGTAERALSEPPATDNARFMAKYADYLGDVGMDASWYAATFSEPITIRLRASRGT